MSAGDDAGRWRIGTRAPNVRAFDAVTGRARYAAAMFFYQRGDMDAGTLEVYRICARLDAEDPLPIIRDRGVGKEWLKRMGFGQ